VGERTVARESVGDKDNSVVAALKLDIKAHVHPDVSIEVDDVDAVHERDRAAGAEIVYPLTDESGACAGSSCAIRTAP
jgi:hypothetical protein